jgi:ubiquinol-cytochrome c reductase iron-sulfur subunit
MAHSDAVNPERRRFLTLATSAVGGAGVVMGAIPFISAFQPSERARAVGGPVEIDISGLEPGQRIIDMWRGQPVWILRRDEASIAALAGLADKLADPLSEVASQQPLYARNVHRSIRPEVLVLLGVCTHLGCSPNYLPQGAADRGADWPGGFFCPCHGSAFDLAGRVFKAVPAPTNMVVPPHRYATDTRLVVGEDQETA